MINETELTKQNVKIIMEKSMEQAKKYLEYCNDKEKKMLLKVERRFWNVIKRKINHSIKNGKNKITLYGKSAFDNDFLYRLNWYGFCAERKSSKPNVPLVYDVSWSKN